MYTSDQHTIFFFRFLVVQLPTSAGWGGGEIVSHERLFSFLRPSPLFFFFFFIRDEGRLG